MKVATTEVSWEHGRRKVVSVKKRLKKLFRKSKSEQSVDQEERLIS